MSTTLLSPAFLATLDQLVLVTRRARAGTFKGERRSPRRGGSVEFADYREYAPGDDFRQIDWNAYARLERLFLRLFVEEEDVTFHIVLDASESMKWGGANGAGDSKWQYAQRLAAALGYIALAGMDRLVAACFPSPVGRGVTQSDADGAQQSAAGLRHRGGGHERIEVFLPHRGKAHALAWFNWLEAREPGGAIEPQAALARYAAYMRRAGPLIVISDLMDEDWQAGIRYLHERDYEITVLHLLSPDELEPALEGDLKLLDSERDTPVEITADFDLLERYRTRVREWQADWTRFCAARAINYVPITTAQPFQDLILSFLRTRAVLK